MDRMIPFLKRIPALFALVLLAGLVAGCPDGLVKDIADSTPPAAPGTLGVVPGDTQLSVSWSAVSHATSYDVFWHTENETATIPEANTDSTTATSCTITGLDNGETHYVWVKARNTAGSSGFSPVGSGTPNGPFTEQNTSSGSSFQVGSGYNDTQNRGVGEKITLAKAYVPTSFSVFVHAANYFKSYTVSGAGSGVAVELRLDIWNQSTGTLLAYSIASINARTTNGEEEVVFTIDDGPIIPANTPVLYAVYLPGSVDLDIRGELYYYASGTDPYSNGIFWRSNNANDATIQTLAGWMEGGVSTHDLKFKLIGIEQ